LQIEPEIRALLEQCPQRRKFDPRLVVCPRCKQVGRAGHYYSTNNNTIHYFVVHHKIAGIWGKSHKHKYKRCYMKNGRENDIFVSKMKLEKRELRRSRKARIGL